MNRKERRAAVARGKAGAGSTASDVAGLMAKANSAYQQDRFEQAEVICRQILARVPAHVGSLNLLGIIEQASGRHKLAVKTFAKALALDELNAACHYNIAASQQALDQPDAATAHFRKAIALGMGDRNVEDLIMQNPVVLACVRQIAEKINLPLGEESPFGAGDIAAIAKDLFLRCALESAVIRGAALEFFLTRLRFALLRVGNDNILEPVKLDASVIALFCALAQQCFINEYVFAQSDEETRLAGRLRERLLQALSGGSEPSALLLAAVAAYFPLHALPGAESLPAKAWPPYAADLVRQQIREPLEEARDRSAIPALTAVDEGVSTQVMHQYEENPYPRWTINPLAVLAGERKKRSEAADREALRAGEEILIAGCGTGQHVLQTAQYFPETRILAVDISRTSLAYARRKTREAGLRNIEYAQADILKLGTLGRSFDRVEAVGVLHHLADPNAGWRVLLSLLRRNGTMRVGLYSEAARRAVVEARALIAEHGYRATAEGIRKFRQTILRDGDSLRWRRITTDADFYSMSGCRDLLFNVVEHRFDIPAIMGFLNEQGLSFLGFELERETIAKFQKQNPGEAALLDLNRWNAFEAENPQTFRYMYLFSVRKN